MKWLNVPAQRRETQFTSFKQHISHLFPHQENQVIHAVTRTVSTEIKLTKTQWQHESLLH